eukprot:NODE_5467_length_1767_cov_4.536585.p1 GENE.NODE_5467_length_1767_cov_4.536585~~NODE_5467_length_1767_cov_4.536585.p1  ORF type:complete len:279 (+),score=56.87 NODE_5467_length_1767_cov_4.536585:385-1221(+)
MRVTRVEEMHGSSAAGSVSARPPMSACPYVIGQNNQQINGPCQSMPSARSPQVGGQQQQLHTGAAVLPSMASTLSPTMSPAMGAGMTPTMSFTMTPGSSADNLSASSLAGGSGGAHLSRSTAPRLHVSPRHASGPSVPHASVLGSIAGPDCVPRVVAEATPVVTTTTGLAIIGPSQKSPGPAARQGSPMQRFGRISLPLELGAIVRPGVMATPSRQSLAGSPASNTRDATHVPTAAATARPLRSASPLTSVRAAPAPGGSQMLMPMSPKVHLRAPSAV